MSRMTAGVGRQVRAEAIKLRTIRSTYLLLAGGVALALVTLAAFLIFIPTDGSVIDAPAIRGLMEISGRGWLFALLIGVIVASGEFRHLTISGTLAAQPSRATVLMAKSLAAAGAGAVLAVVSVAICALIIIVDLLGQAPLGTLAVAAALQAVGSILAFALAAIAGVGLGALLRVQVAAVVVALIWVLAVEPILALAWTAGAPWLPGTAVTTLGATGLATDLAEASRSLGVLALVAGALVVVAALTTMRRDITA